MSITGEIQGLYKDRAQTQAVFPVTKVKAVSDDNGTGLDALLKDLNPAQWGLGVRVVNEDGYGYRQVNLAEADALDKTGIYWFRDDVYRFYPDGWASGSAGILIHIQHNMVNSNSAKQIFIPYSKCGVRDSDGPDSYVIVERTKRNSEGTWTPVEWRNPPMIPGVEYRTTERWNGKPVYAQLVNLGTLPNATSGAVPLHIIGAETFIDYNLVGTSTSNPQYQNLNTTDIELVFGFNDPGNANGSTWVDIHAKTNNSAYTGKLSVKYTKV